MGLSPRNPAAPRSVVMTGKTSQDKTAELLGTKTTFREERRAYQPQLCPALAGGRGLPGPWTALTWRSSRWPGSNCPSSAKTGLLEIIPGGQPRRRAPAPGHRPLRAARPREATTSLPGSSRPPKRAIPTAVLIGFLAGPKGIITNQHLEVTGEMVAHYKNSGGFHMLGTGRDKIDTPEKMEQCRQTCAALKLDGLVVVGGDDSNTNAAFLAENLREAGHPGHRHPQDHRRRPPGPGPAAAPLSATTPPAWPLPPRSATSIPTASRI